MTIALIGPSGAGKGTQALKLSAKYDFLHISTGDLFRASLEKTSILGLLAKRYLKKGELVPDEVVGAMIEEWLYKIMPGKPILFDGFPRTRYQADILDALFQKTDRNLAAVLYLKVSDDEILRRLPGRMICRTCQTPYHIKFKPPAIKGRCDLCRGELYRRDDDKPEIIPARLKSSHRAIEPLLDYYQATGKLVIVDGHGTIDEVHQALVEAIEAIQTHTVRLATPDEVREIQPLKGSVLPLSLAEVEHPALDIVLLGGPGSGKGTQAKALKQHLNLEHVATGDLFRENIKNQTGLGRLAKTYIDQGELVPDDVTEAMLRERLLQGGQHNGYILDGFPRTPPQAEALTEILNSLGRRLAAVLHIKVEDEEIIARLSGRLTCRKCQTPYHATYNPPQQKGICDRCSGELYQRDDDNPETVRARLKTYQAQTRPLIKYYHEAGLLVEIDGTGELTEVTNRALAVLKKLDVAKKVTHH